LTGVRRSAGAVVRSWRLADHPPRDEAARVRRHALEHEPGLVQPGPSRTAAKTLGDSKCGKHSQSMDPLVPTRAAVCMSPMRP